MWGFPIFFVVSSSVFSIVHLLIARKAPCFLQVAHFLSCVPVVAPGTRFLKNVSVACIQRRPFFAPGFLCWLAPCNFLGFVWASRPLPHRAASILLFFVSMFISLFFFVGGWTGQFGTGSVHSPLYLCILKIIIILALELRPSSATPLALLRPCVTSFSFQLSAFYDTPPACVRHCPVL
jgi:hypothetical protein